MSVKEIFVVMTFIVITWKSLGLKWTTETLHTSCCEGQDKILMWNCSLEKNETVQDNLWLFQSTRIAYVSKSVKFDVHDLYQGRLEQIGKMGILLKNVSSVDTGNYSLYLNLGPEPPENMQTIFLTVFDCKISENCMSLTITVKVLATTNVLSIVVICLICRKKICRLCAKRCKNTDNVQEPNNKPETRSMIEERRMAAIEKLEHEREFRINGFTSDFET
ncbi:hypothetical protein ACJMK2_025776 [Sinanodonta woodiana]|uniref:Uncharacterized protein n=1 Tax=Sinanodonta woodiana TaxID=1069815 RepID=A0ABD3XJE5_SINWO